MARKNKHIPWNNLVAPPRFQSLPVSETDRNRRTYQGFLKLRLCHSLGRTYLIPDVLIAVAGSRYFLPRFFSPPMIGFNVDEDGHHLARLSIDVGPPRAMDLARLNITLAAKDRLLSYDDGAQLYRCTFSGPRRISNYASGLCHILPNGDYALHAYHHTTPENATMIKESKVLWSSPWNLAGTRELKNIYYTYFTTLPQIRNEDDLRLIAMSSSEHIHFQTTSNRMHEEVLSLKVYRGNTSDRTHALRFYVPCGIIAPSHLLLHPNVGANPAYYEVVGPDIIRVGVRPSSVLQIYGHDTSVTQTSLKSFDYVIVGEASSLEGIAAPYDEEETKCIAHLEKLNEDLDFFQFWWTHQNTDQVTGRTFEPRAFKVP